MPPAFLAKFEVFAVYIRLCRDKSDCLIVPIKKVHTRETAFQKPKTKVDVRNSLN